VAEPPIVNASPLIFLAKGGCFDLLRVAGDIVLVPAAVMGELNRRGPSDPTVRAVQQANWLTVVQSPPPPDVILSWDLGPGESAVLAWALAHPGSEAICDDLAARRCAQALGLPLRGTVGMILVAKQRGMIDAARPVVEKLVRAGMYLSERTMNESLAIVNE
jgi:predicted nucleic acid-binding protein